MANAEPTRDNGWHIARLPLESIESAAPTLLGIELEFEIVEPAELRIEISRFAKLVCKE